MLRTEKDSAFGLLMNDLASNLEDKLAASSSLPKKGGGKAVAAEGCFGRSLIPLSPVSLHRSGRRGRKYQFVRLAIDLRSRSI